jgi:hypothetical protein
VARAGLQQAAALGTRQLQFDANADAYAIILGMMSNQSSRLQLPQFQPYPLEIQPLDAPSPQQTAPPLQPAPAVNFDGEDFDGIDVLYADELYASHLRAKRNGIPDEDDVSALQWASDMKAHTFGHRIDTDKSDKYLFNQPVAVAAKPAVLSYTIPAADRFKLLNMWMANIGVCMDSDVVGVKKLADLKKQLAESHVATHGQFRDLLSRIVRRRIVLLPCTTSYTSKQDVVDHHYRDAFNDAIVGNIVVLHHVDERTGECVLFGIGVVVEKAMANDQGVHAFADPKSSGILLPVMILTILDANPYDADAISDYGGAFSGGSVRGDDWTKICVSQGTIAGQRALPAPLSIWIAENALSHAAEAIRTTGGRGMAVETRRAILLRSLVQGVTPLSGIFEAGQRALECEPCFPPTLDSSTKKRCRDSAKEVVLRLKTTHKHRRVYNWGAA